MQRIFITAILMLLLSQTMFSQRKDRIPVLSDVLDYFSGLENDTLSFIETNWWDNKEISGIIGGIRFSGYYTEDKTQGIVLNEVTEMPVWHEGPDHSKFGVSAGFSVNPFFIQFNYSEHEIDLNDAEQVFALPPVNPGGNSLLDDALIIKNAHLEVDYIPVSLFWGYVHLTTGIVVNGKMFFHDEVAKSYLSLGLQTGAFFKYKHIFAGASISRFLIKPGFFKHSDDIKFEAGIWFNVY